MNCKLEIKPSLFSFEGALAFLTLGFARQTFPKHQYLPKNVQCVRHKFLAEAAAAFYLERQSVLHCYKSHAAVSRTQQWINLTSDTSHFYALQKYTVLSKYCKQGRTVIRIAAIPQCKH